MRPVEILKQHPAPWTQVTYQDGTIQVFDAQGVEVGLISILTFSIGIANSTVKAAEPAAAGA